MRDSVVREVPFVHAFRTKVAKRNTAVREARSVSARIPYVGKFDETYVVTLRDGTDVPMGRSGDRFFVRAPWETRIPTQGQYSRSAIKALGEVDPTAVAMQRGEARHVRDRPHMNSHVDRRTPELDAGVAAASERIVRWLGSSLVVDDDLYVPTMGVTVHVAEHPKQRYRAVPVVQFGWGGQRDVASMVDAWSPGWEPEGGWDVGALRVPRDVLADPLTVALAKAIERIDPSPHWGMVAYEGGGPYGETVRRFRDAWSTGDPVVAAAGLRDYTATNPSMTGNGKYLTDVVDAMSSEQFAAYEEYPSSIPTVVEAAPDALDALPVGL